MKTLIRILTIALTIASATAQTLTVNRNDLTPELRDRAKALGYNEQEAVPVTIGATGELAVVPKDVAEVKAKVLALVADKIAKRADAATLSAQVNLATLQAETFAVRSPFANLQAPLQSDAQKKGYGQDDDVVVNVDAKTMAYEVAAKQLRISFQPEALLPGNVVRGRVRFADLPPDMQRRASELTYAKGSSVRLQVANGKFDVLPPEFFIGVKSSFDKLKDKRKASGLGYKSGDAVWSAFGADGVAMLPSSGQIKVLKPGDAEKMTWAK